MNDDDQDDPIAAADEAFAIGYGRPPPQHRFKPGRSGNPRGRPKRNTSLEAAFQEMLGSTTITTINGKRQRKSVIELAVLRAKKDILTGHPRALERWLPVIERYAPKLKQSERTENVDFTNLTAEELRVLASIKIHGRIDPIR
jgi:hypothetical protein